MSISEAACDSIFVSSCLQLTLWILWSVGSTLSYLEVWGSSFGWGWPSCQTFGSSSWSLQAYARIAP